MSEFHIPYKIKSPLKLHTAINFSNKKKKERDQKEANERFLKTSSKPEALIVDTEASFASWGVFTI